MQINKETILDIALLICLLILSVEDIKERKINVLFILPIAVVTGSVSLYYGMASKTLLIALIPGALLILTAVLFPEKIGVGDGVTVALIACGIGRAVFMALFLSFFICSVLSLILLALRKVNRNSKIPFVPFLALGTGICVLFGV